ncbi:MAG: hypothetical protein LBU79_02965 [Planctomycetota bacterium]|nr:hypothetical protein [Planctomycetota bacterium]
MKRPILPGHPFPGGLRNTPNRTLQPLPSTLASFISQGLGEIDILPRLKTGDSYSVQPEIRLG